MQEQITLFEFAAKGMKAQAEINKLCHRDDSDTSFDAAEKLVASGELNRQETEVWRWGREHQTVAGITPKELASKVASKGGGSYHPIYYEIQRRLSGLEQKSKAIRFLINGTQLVREGCGVWRFI